MSIANNIVYEAIMLPKKMNNDLHKFRHINNGLHQLIINYN